MIPTCDCDCLIIQYCIGHPWSSWKWVERVRGWTDYEKRLLKCFGGNPSGLVGPLWIEREIPGESWHPFGGIVLEDSWHLLLPLEEWSWRICRPCYQLWLQVTADLILKMMLNFFPQILNVTDFELIRQYIYNYSYWDGGVEYFLGFQISSDLLGGTSRTMIPSLWRQSCIENWAFLHHGENHLPRTHFARCFPYNIDISYHLWNIHFIMGNLEISQARGPEQYISMSWKHNVHEQTPLILKVCYA